MNIPYRIRLENGRISEQNDCCVIESLAPSITWAVAGMADDNYQKAYRIRVTNIQEELWDTGWVESREQVAGIREKPSRRVRSVRCLWRYRMSTAIRVNVRAFVSVTADWIRGLDNG